VDWVTLCEWSSRALLAALLVASAARGALAQSGSTAEPAPPAVEEQPPPIEYSWQDGKTTLNFSAAEVTVSNRVQVLSIGRHRDGRPTERSLGIPRARTEFAGWLFSEHLTYEAQFDWAEGVELQDLHLALDLLRDDTLEIKAGQFKVPFSRQRLTSSGSQQFVDRAIMVDEFAEGRDIGVQLSGLISDKRVEYRLGVFNGAGQNSLADAGGLQYNGRVVFQPFGELAYAEGDFAGSEVPRLAIAGNAEYRAAGNDDTEGRTRRIVGTDIALHYRGWSILGEAYLRDVLHVAEPTVRSTGAFIQSGYFLIPRRLEIAGRLARWESEEPPALSDPGSALRAGRREAGLAIGYFLNDHNLKLQSDVRRLDQPGLTHPAFEVRFQLQVVF
jgi:phosphate-selective porin OprO and OprP